MIIVIITITITIAIAVTIVMITVAVAVIVAPIVVQPTRLSITIPHLTSSAFEFVISTTRVL